MSERTSAHQQIGLMLQLSLTSAPVFCICSLLNLCSVKNQDAVLKLAVSTLDYSRDGLARVILSKILTAATDVKQLYTKHR